MRHAWLLALLLPIAASAEPPALAAQVAGRAAVVLRKPLPGEPLQGFSSVTARDDGTYWVLADTGHASRKQPQPAQPVFHHLYIDWIDGRAKLLSSVALRDPQRRLPVPVAQLNLDAMRALGNGVWFADDRGPWLVESDFGGRVLAVHRAAVDGVSVDAAAIRRGFGGLAVSRDGRFLYAAFEGPLWSQPGWERTVDGRPYLRILEFDRRARQWTGRAIRYALEAEGHTLADLALLERDAALVVERGPQFRRIYRVSLARDEAKKLAFVDLVGIRMATVEGIDVIDPGYIVLTQGDRTELVLLRAPQLLGEP